MLPLSAESRCLATGLPSANTVLDPLLIFAECPTHLAGQQTNIVCGRSLSPGLRTLLPLMNTLLAVALQPIDVVQACPVLALSILSLDIAGMPVFMCSGNRWCYSLSYMGTMDLQIAVRPSFKTLVTLQSYPVIDDNILSSVVFLPFADKPRSTAPLA